MVATRCESVVSYSMDQGQEWRVQAASSLQRRGQAASSLERRGQAASSLQRRGQAASSLQRRGQAASSLERRGQAASSGTTDWAYLELHLKPPPRQTILGRQLAPHALTWRERVGHHSCVACNLWVNEAWAAAKSCGVVLPCEGSVDWTVLDSAWCNLPRTHHVWYSMYIREKNYVINLGSNPNVLSSPSLKHTQ